MHVEAVVTVNHETCHVHLHNRVAVVLTANGRWPASSKNDMVHFSMRIVSMERGMVPRAWHRITHCMPNIGKHANDEITYTCNTRHP